jgi:uncharacterized protein YkwD
MSGSSASRRRQTPKGNRGPAKVIRMPTPRVVRRKRAVKAGMSLLALSLVATLIARLYLMRTSPPSPEKMAALSDQESKILKLVNAERGRAGLKPLRFSARLAVIARGHSNDMAMRRYLDYSSPDGIGPAQRVRGAGISYDAVGENIYMGDYREDETIPERAVERWLASAEHRATMLSREFTDTGVGIARSGDGSIYVTQDFVH